VDGEPQEVETKDEEMKRKLTAINRAMRLVSGMKKKCLKYVGAASLPIQTDGLELIINIKCFILTAFPFIQTHGWWSYEFCHLNQIKQFSVPNPTYPKWPKLEYKLGVWKELANPEAFYGDLEMHGAGGAELVDNDEEGSKYLRVWYGGGDFCETKGRVVEVQVSE
jgi:hypothetical protein